jgi:DUF4097 and DUF4098 domain-containing protein YvlB
MPKRFSLTIKFLPCLLLLMALPSAAGDSLEKVFPVSRNPVLIITSYSGWISIRSWQRQEIKVLGSNYSSNVEVDTEASANKVRLTTHVIDRLATPDRSKIDYQIFTPEESTVEVKTNLGGVVIENIKGEVRIDVFNAAVKVSGAAGFINVKTLGSQLEIIDCSGPVQASTVSGDIILRGLSSRSVAAQSTQGNILYDGDLFSHGNYNFTTNAGNIQIFCNERASVEWDARTVKGVIESDLPIFSKGHHYTTPNLIGRQSLVGTLNDGEATVQLSTFSGKIKINRK